MVVVSCKSHDGAVKPGIIGIVGLAIDIKGVTTDGATFGAHGVYDEVDSNVHKGYHSVVHHSPPDPGGMVLAE